MSSISSEVMQKANNLGELINKLIDSKNQCQSELNTQKATADQLTKDLNNAVAENQRHVADVALKKETFENDKKKLDENLKKLNLDVQGKDAELKSAIDKMREISEKSDQLQKEHEQIIEKLQRDHTNSITANNVYLRNNFKTQLTEQKAELNAKSELEMRQLNAKSEAEKAELHNKIEDEKTKYIENLSILESQLTSIQESLSVSKSENDVLAKNLAEQQVVLIQNLEKIVESETAGFESQQNIIKLQTQLDEANKIIQFLNGKMDEFISKINAPGADPGASGGIAPSGSGSGGVVNSANPASVTDTKFGNIPARIRGTRIHSGVTGAKNTPLDVEIKPSTGGSNKKSRKPKNKFPKVVKKTKKNKQRKTKKITRK